jgi:predicted nucleic acid-binding protein
MLVVADTSALLALASCNNLFLLNALFREIRVPPAVFQECTVAGKPEAERLTDYLRDKVLAVADLSDFVIAAMGLGRGELEAMALYKRLRADVLLLDDSRARKIACLNDIEVIGSLGVLLLAKSNNLLRAIKPSVNSIQAAGVYLSESLVAEALRLAGEIEGSS